MSVHQFYSRPALWVTTGLEVYATFVSVTYPGKVYVKWGEEEAAYAPIEELEFL